jgi:hypothetical protein
MGTPNLNALGIGKLADFFIAERVTAYSTATQTQNGQEKSYNKRPKIALVQFFSLRLI